VEFELESEISYSAYLCWIGLGWDWIWTIVQFVEFGLDPDYKSLQNLGSGPHLDWVNGKEMGHFCCEKTSLFKFLDLDFTFEKSFGLWLDLDWVLKNQDLIWITKYDSPFTSAAGLPFSAIQWSNYKNLQLMMPIGLDALLVTQYKSIYHSPQRFQIPAMLNTKPRCTLIGHAIDKIFNQCTR